MNTVRLIINKIGRRLSEARVESMLIITQFLLYSTPAIFRDFPKCTKFFFRLEQIVYICRA